MKEGGHFEKNQILFLDTSENDENFQNFEIQENEVFHIKKPEIDLEIIPVKPKKLPGIS